MRIPTRRPRAILAVLVLLLLPSSLFAADPATDRARRDANLRPFAGGAGLKMENASEPWRGDGRLPALDALGDSAGAWTEFAPPRRWSAHLAIDAAGERVFVVGNQNGNPGGDLWSLSLVSPAGWQRILTPAVNAPLSLERASSAWDAARGRLILFGGELPYPGGRLDLAYVLTLDPEPRWALVPFRDGPRPGGRTEAATAYDGDADRLIVFAGWGTSNNETRGVVSDVWTLDLSPARRGWSQVEPAGEGPSPRVAASAVVVPGTSRVLCYGGLVFTAPSILEASDELWELTLGDAPAWSRVTAGGDLPPAEANHAAFWDAASGRMIVVSGSGDGSTHAYDPLTQVWTRLDTGAAPSGGWPGPVVHDPSRGRYLFYNRRYDAIDSAHLDALTLGPGASWKRLLDPDLPRGRFGHASIHDAAGDRLIVFGGVSDRDAYGYLADPWSLDLSDLTRWQPLSATSAPPPPPRHEPVGIYDPRSERGIFFGGWTYPDNYFNDVWELDACCGKADWRPLSPAGEAPVGRRAHSAVYDPLRHRMLVFGGSDKDSALGDLWALELGDAPRWTRLEPRGGGPGPRYFPAMVYDPLRDRVLVHGGHYGSQSRDDLWELSLGDLQWTPLAVDGYGLALERHGLVHDTGRDRLLVFGGWSLDGHVGWISGALYTLGLPEPRRWGSLWSGAPWPDSRIALTWLHDFRRDRVIAFAGGGLGEYRNDLWSLDFTLREPARTWLLGATTGEGRATIAWRLGSALGADVARREESGPWRSLGRRSSDANHELVVTDTGLRAGARYTYRVRPLLDLGFPPTYDDSPPEVTVTIPGGPALRLLASRPNPARSGEVALWFALDDPAGAVLEIRDVRGRRVWQRGLDGLPPGLQFVRPALHLPAGLYFTRLRQGEVQATGKLVIIP